MHRSVGKLELLGCLKTKGKESETEKCKLEKTYPFDSWTPRAGGCENVTFPGQIKPQARGRLDLFTLILEIDMAELTQFINGVELMADVDDRRNPDSEETTTDHLGTVVDLRCQVPAQKCHLPGTWSKLQFNWSKMQIAS